jgi:hypothetical protein
MPIQALKEFQEVEARRFQDSRHMKVVKLSALRTGHLYPPGSIPDTQFCRRLSRVQGYSEAGKILVTSGIEPENSQLVKQCLNELCHHVPPNSGKVKIKTVEDVDRMKVQLPTIFCDVLYAFIFAN